MSKLIVANWKMNKPPYDILPSISSIKTSNKIILAPPFPYLKEISSMGFDVCAQDCSHLSNVTGEISADMLKSLDVNYSIIGHSERRHIDNDYTLSSKLKMCLDNDIIPIYCISNIDELKLVNNDNIIIAYEPLHNIGANIDVDMSDVISKYNYIKSCLGNKVLYGGNCNIDNAKDILNITDGLLIGRASLTKSFLNICSI